MAVDKGAMLYLEKPFSDKLSGEKVAMVLSTYGLRGDGSYGETTTEVPTVHLIPAPSPADSISLTTLPPSGLIYRLSSDYNPIHASPEIVRKASFDRPILHGLCAIGVAARAILQALCDDQPERLHSVSLRFSSPVCPGATIMTEFWKTDSGVSFRATATERKVAVLNFGHVVID